MIPQGEVHKCKKMPHVAITKTKIDGKWTEWYLTVNATSREATFDCNVNNIHYCPYCGEELK